MKKYILLMTGLLILISPGLFAEEASEIERMISAIKADKKDLVAKNMELTGKEQKDFWPLFEEYQEQLGAIDVRMGKLLDEYLRASKSMSKKHAKELLKGYLDAEKERLKLKNSYERKFRKILPVEKVVEYFYLESKLNAIKSLEIFAALPLVY